MSILRKTIKKIFSVNRNNLLLNSSISGPPTVETIQQREGGAIICFLVDSEGGALAKLTNELIQPIANRSTKVFRLNLTQPDWPKELETALSEPVWFIFSAFGGGQAIDVNVDGRRRNLWEAAKIPFVRVYGDIPAYYPDRHVGKYVNSINAYGDSSHADFYRKWFSDKAFTILLPPFPMEARPLQEIDESAQRKGPIIFPKNGNSPEALIDYWRTALPSPMVKALESVAEECLSKDNINSNPCIDSRLLRYYQNAHFDLASARSVLCFMVAQIDDYLRRYKSTLIAQSILDLPVVVSGKNWEHVNFSGKKAIYDSNSDFASTRARIDDAPAIIDMSPNVMHSAHDRICRAVGRGTAFLTNKNEYMPESIGINTEYIFSFDKNSIHDVVEHCVLNPDEAIKLGIFQSRAFRELYTTEKYCEVLLSAVQIMSFALGECPSGTQNFVDFPHKDFR